MREVGGRVCCEIFGCLLVGCVGMCGASLLGALDGDIGWWVV
jgi:hypothetical protein